MRDTPHHQYQVLTKRPERLPEVDAALEEAFGGWPANVVMGVSVEDAAVLHRVDPLRACGAVTTFVSAEPLLGSLAGLDLAEIDWLIAGGESGRGAQPMDPAWARELRDLCVQAGVPYFFKQWGASDENGRRVGKKRAGRVLDGRTWDERPAVPGFHDPGATGLAVPPPLTDEEWARVAPVVGERAGDDERAAVEAVRYTAWTGRPWHELPAEYGGGHDAARRVTHWRMGGRWLPICERLNDPLVSHITSS